MLVGGIVVEDGVDELTGRHRGLDPIEQTDELLVAMSRHALTNHGAIEDIERGPVAVRRRATRCWVRL